MKRILLFLLTNLAILVVLGLVLQLLGVERILDDAGVGLNYTSLLAFAAVFGMGGSLLSLALSKWTAKRLTGATVIQTPRSEAETWLFETVSRHASAAGIAKPEIAIYEAPEANAFATGARRDRALVAVSTGLVRQMNREQVDAVLAHEVSHVANGDMVTLTLIQGVVNTFVIFASRVIGHAVDRAVFKTERGHGPAFYVTAIVAQLLLGILATLVVVHFSRQREFRADAGGARLAGRERMIGALQRLKEASSGPLPDQLAAFGISGAKRGGILRLFATHPSLDERIAALRG